MSNDTRSGFTVENGDADSLAKLDHALNYLMESPTAAAIINAAMQSGTIIGINPFGADNYGPDFNPASTAYDHDNDIAIWNPDSALQVMKLDGTIVGVQSAALGLLHELVHAIDPGLIDNLSQKLSGYRNLTEYTAIQYETMVAQELGEVTRDNWRGNDIIAFNPTTRTMEDENGGLLWAQLNQFGVEEYGPLFVPQGATPLDFVPMFGSTEDGSFVDEQDFEGWMNSPVIANRPTTELRVPSSHSHEISHIVEPGPASIDFVGSAAGLILLI